MLTGRFLGKESTVRIYSTLFAKKIKGWLKNVNPAVALAVRIPRANTSADPALITAGRHHPARHWERQYISLPFSRLMLPRRKMSFTGSRWSLIILSSLSKGHRGPFGRLVLLPRTRRRSERIA
jgi:hypothetical protein